MAVFEDSSGLEGQLHSGASSPSLTASLLSTSSSSYRSVSGVSTISSQSSYSNGSTTASSSASGTRRRGYIRPQGSTFAPSAQNRDSVMSLGSIAHLQYYFARTGLLDGKGGQMAKKKENGEYDIPRFSLDGKADVVESPVDAEGQALWEAAQEDGEEVMLPPTVSTYCHRTDYVPPPPDQKTLKRDLVEALENALQALESCEKAATEEEPTQGFYEIEGLHILDTTTLAIRAARLYYTMHTDPKRLNSIRPDHQIRRDLYNVLEVLKKCAARNFAGGLKEDERLAILIWVSDVGMMIDQEAKLEEAERKARSNWLWMDDARWTNVAEDDRDLCFLFFLSENDDIMPRSIEEQVAGKSQFMQSLKDGRKLISMHNAAVRRSKKQFGQIDKVHQDVGKPYRRADNIRFWLKAAELRFEIILKVDVMAIANKPGDASVSSAFESVVLQWSRRVRAELTKDWSGEEERKLHMRAKSLALASPFGSPAKPKESNAMRSTVLDEED